LAKYCWKTSSIGGSIQFLKKWKIHNLDAYNFGQLLLVHKQKVPYLYKTISREFLHKIFAQKLRKCRRYGNNDVSRWWIFVSFLAYRVAAVTRSLDSMTVSNFPYSWIGWRDPKALTEVFRFL
jgi:hypothetical protein